MTPGDRNCVLLVEDEPGANPVVDTVFGQLGQLLVRAASAEAALAHARGTDFALVLVGMRGPVAQVLEAVRVIHDNRRSSHTPVIVLASGPAFPAGQAYQAGAIDVLAAPVVPAVLAAKARFFLDTVGIAADRQRVEDALRDTRARLDATLADAELATWSLDLRADRVSADSTMARLFNVSAAEADGGSVEAYFRAIHPADSEATRALLRHALESGQPYDAAFRVLGADGICRSVIARARVKYGADGGRAWLPGVVIDVTRQKNAEAELRASEERYRTLFESIDVGVCVIEVLFDAAEQPFDYRFLEMNPAFLQHTGLADALGKTVLELVPGHDAHWFAVYGRVASSGEPVRFVDQAKAMGRWYDVYATRVGAAASRKVAVFFTDISERMRADQELRRLAADLSDADRRKTEFLATLAHELRNPLAPIRSGLQVMRLAAGNPATMARMQDIMERQLTHMVELVDDLLDVARITRGQVELKTAAVDLKDVLSAAVETSLPQIEASQHQLQLRIADQAFPLQADATRLTQVVSNLLNNAAKYTPRGGSIVLAAAREGGEAVLSVTDNGIGIAAESLAAVFDMFTQVGRDSSRTQGGLGIGLSLVRSLVELHGGSVTAASGGAGQGSVFSVRLPLAPPEAAQGAAPSASAAVGAGNDGRLRVLVVDDNVDAAETLSGLLELLGHTVLVANDGAQALRLLPSFRPDLAFLDIGMPGLSGYQVAAAIRRDRQFDQLTLVALTGWGGDNDRAHSLQAGFDLHLTKPVTVSAIETMLAGLRPA
jgi:PAS domain S-box-containing protein